MTAHRLVAYRRGGGRVALAEFPTYGEAVAAFDVAVAMSTEFPGNNGYAVRSADDPGWNMTLLSPREAHGFYDRVAVQGGVREHRRLELNDAARWAVRKGARDGLRYNQVEALVVRSLHERGLTVDRYDVDRAVKSRVLLGRCAKGRYSGPGCDRAFWLPTSEGPLHSVRCPGCGERLGQTTLALRAGFARLPVAVPA